MMSYLGKLERCLAADLINKQITGGIPLILATVEIADLAVLGQL